MNGRAIKGSKRVFRFGKKEEKKLLKIRKRLLFKNSSTNFAILFASSIDVMIYRGEFNYT